ncbi:cellulase [Moelleriella libera RCEF 2490]|uniref:Cellulase n=1 Tax=Moelleriella libera RCEF 2490 TaxID=1081109 RepID=A0A166RNR3_9HYPO|nr:cellulase [Moelleriella libera RCEF 2490]
MGNAIRLPGPFTGDAAWAGNRQANDCAQCNDGTESPPRISLPAATATATVDDADTDLEWVKSRPGEGRSSSSSSSSSAWGTQPGKIMMVRRRPRRFWICTWVLVLLGIMCGYFLASEWSVNRAWKPDQQSLAFAGRPLPPPLNRTLITSYELPLRTSGRHIVDARGRRFRLSSVNWYGASDELFVPGGLDVQHRTTIARTIKKLGFNSVRLPYADELVTRNPVVDGRWLRANGDLVGLRALDVLEAVTSALTGEGIAVIINNHITRATWCCGADPCDAGWANDGLSPFCSVRQTEEQWVRNWETVMARFTRNALVVGVDLRNEEAPVWVGELGAPREPTVGDWRYWSHLWRFLKSVDADFGYWALNPRKPAGNASEGYALLRDDWVTPVLDYRMKDMQELMRA